MQTTETTFSQSFTGIFITFSLLNNGPFDFKSLKNVATYNGHFDYKLLKFVTVFLV